MTDTGNTLRGIDWRTASPFIRLFRGFRLAIDPSKLILAMALIILTYTGGRLLDGIWPNKHQAVVFDRGVPTTPLLLNNDYSLDTLTRSRGSIAASGLAGQPVSELQAYQASASDRGMFKILRSSRLAQMRAQTEALLAAEGKDTNGSISDLRNAYAHDRDERVRQINDAHDALPKEQRADRKALRDAEVRSAYAGYVVKDSVLETIEPRGLFITFLDYEIDQIDRLANAAVRLDIGRSFNAVYNFLITAPRWAFSQHPVYFSIFFVYFLLLWSVFGGALARIAAVQEARDEKISVRQALRFSTGKVLSFFFAPVIPLLIIAAIAVLLGAAYAGVQIPWGIGGIWLILVGIVFFLALLGGLVMALTSIGLLGGGHMMYPTIAVEGSDSFDAVSRSFSYLYARPWQLVWYTLVSLVYGAITYLFVRFFVYILLGLTLMAISLFIYGRADSGQPLMSAIWPMHRGWTQLSYNPNFAAMGPLYDIGSFFMSFWIYLTISLVGAYAISLYFSSSTIIYYLMRREVDATATDEVYLEPSDDDFVDTVGPDTMAVAPEGDPLRPSDADSAGLTTAAAGSGVVVETVTVSPITGDLPEDRPVPPTEQANGDQTTGGETTRESRVETIIDTSSPDSPLYSGTTTGGSAEQVAESDRSRADNPENRAEEGSPDDRADRDNPDRPAV